MSGTGESLEDRFNAICIKLWGKAEGQDIHDWIEGSRPAGFHKISMELMVPVWEMDRVDIKTKILCMICLFAGSYREEVRFFFKMAKHHRIPQEDVEEVLVLTGLEAGFPAAEKAVQMLVEVYSENGDVETSKGE